MFDFTLITIASIAAVGVMELLKLYLPEATSVKIKGLISLVLSIIAAVGIGLVKGLDVQSLVLNAGAVVGLVQFSYDTVVKLFKKVIAYIESKVTIDDAQIPVLEAQMENELNALLASAEAKTKEAENAEVKE